jgi:hypothetical protein
MLLARARGMPSGSHNVERTPRFEVRAPDFSAASISTLGTRLFSGTPGVFALPVVVSLF